MPWSVAKAFEDLRGWFTPHETETASAASHRRSVHGCLSNNYRLTNFFRAGSFGHGTSLAQISDIDYFAVIDEEDLYSDSARALGELRRVLQRRFPTSGVHVSSPAVVIPFGRRPSERHEITPAWYSHSQRGFAVYYIPDRAGGWMLSCPDGHNDFVNRIHARLAKRVKSLIRFLKIWNHYNDIGLRSIYLELRVAQYCRREQAVIYSHDILGVLTHLSDVGLVAMRDPLGLSAPIQPCALSRHPVVLARLNAAIRLVGRAVEADLHNDPETAFFWWSKVFDGIFPSYGD